MANPAPPTAVDVEKATVLLDAMIAECTTVAEAALGRGRRYYFISYLLMIMSVGGSVLAGILALFAEVSKDWVGTVALVPALCATVAGQLRLVEKGDWHYRRRNAMRKLARDFQLERDRGADLDRVAAANDRLSKIEVQFEHEWSQNNAFRFDAEPTGG